MSSNDFNELIYDVTGYNKRKQAHATQAILQFGEAAIPLMGEAIKKGVIPAYDAYRILLNLDQGSRKKLFKAGCSHNTKALLKSIEMHPTAIPEVISFAGTMIENPIFTLDCLNTLFAVHPKIEIQYPGYLDEYYLLTDSLLASLRYKEPESYSAMLLIALLRPDPQRTIPIILECLENANQSDLIFYASLMTLREYGTSAIEATDVLVGLIATSPGYEFRITEVLTDIGASPERIIPALLKCLESREPVQQSFKKAMDKKISSIAQTVQAVKKPLKAKYEPMLNNYIHRLHSEDRGVFSSANSTSYKASREVELVSDCSLIPEITNALSKRVATRDFNSIVKILGYLTRNSRNPEGKLLLKSLLDRPNLSNSQINAIIEAAGVAGLNDLAPKIINLAVKSDVHEGSVRSFIEDTQCDTEIDLIKTLVANSSEKHSRLLWIFTLGKIGTPAVLPILEDFARRQYTSKKKAEFEWRHYSINAIGNIGCIESVSLLIELLADEGYRDVNHILIKSLCELRDESALSIIVAQIKGYILNERFASRWSNGYLTPIVNAFGYFDDIGVSKDEEVLLLAKVLVEEHWNKLFMQEQDFILRVYPELEPEPREFQVVDKNSGIKGIIDRFKSRFTKK